MGKESDFQAFFQQAKTYYQSVKDQTTRYFHAQYPSLERIYALEDSMIGDLKREYRRLGTHRYTGQNPMLEIKNIVRLFYFRERGKKTSLSEMNDYTREFLRRNNRNVFKKPPLNGQPAKELINDLLKHRLVMPGNGPSEVFREWLPEQFERALQVIPEPILSEGGFGKGCRVMGGVFLYALTDLPLHASDQLIHDRISTALKGGFYYGMFYPLIDDMIDHAKVLSPEEKGELFNLLNHWIGGDFSCENTLKQYQSMCLLEEIFKDFHQLLPIENHRSLYLAAYALHFSQIEDAVKSFDKEYKWDDFYVSVILKAAYTRIVAAGIAGVPLDDAFISHMITTGMSFQLMDDFRDWVSDLEHKLLTPFTYHFHSPDRENQINPFSLYLATLKLYFQQFSNDPLLERLVMRRLAISIQRFLPKELDSDIEERIWQIVGRNAETGRWVHKIHSMNYRALDPDAEYTRPIDHVVNRGFR